MAITQKTRDLLQFRNSTPIKFAARCGAGLRCRTADVLSDGQCRTRRDPDHIESECDDGNTGHCNLPLVRASGALAWHVSVPKRADHRSDRARWARVLEAVDLGVREFQLKPASLQARVLSRAPWSPDQVIDTASPSANPGHAGGRECSPCTTGPKLKSDINSIRVRSFILTGAPTKLLISLKHNGRSGAACYLAERVK